METLVANLTTRELEALVEKAIDQRMEVWLTQLLDALYASPNERDDALQPSFAAALQRSLDQARAGEVMDLETFRTQL